MAAGSGDSFEGGIKLQSKKNLKEPNMYRVILHNDNYTTMEFGVEVLMKVFHMPAPRATQVMQDVHKTGRGVCGIYTYDVAITKVDEVHSMAKAREFPLRCSCEKV